MLISVEPSLRVVVLMGTFNGARFLGLQLDSIVSQHHEDWSVFCSDDGSTDSTREILRAYQGSFEPGRFVLLAGPGRGFVANFLSMVADEGIEGDFFAFADQDDVWLPDKLACAVKALKGLPAGVPALYCGRTVLMGESGEVLGCSLLDHVLPSFGNAMIQNVASGNTMVFNAAARDVLMRAGVDVDVFAHDWWLYLAVMAVGGTVLFDSTPRVKYRQHERNQIGATMTLTGLLRRTRLDRNGHLRSTFRRNIAALEHIRHRITPENLALLNKVDRLSHPNPLRRLMAFFQLPFKRQRFLGNCSLGLAIFLGRV
jgi:glycosyltransferase involved in cell wall biosynthesis